MSERPGLGNEQGERDGGDSRDHIDGITGLRARLIKLSYTNSCLCLSVCLSVKGYILLRGKGDLLGLGRQWEPDMEDLGSLPNELLPRSKGCLAYDEPIANVGHIHPLH